MEKKKSPEGLEKNNLNIDEWVNNFNLNVFIEKVKDNLPESYKHVDIRQGSILYDIARITIVTFVKELKGIQ